MVRRQRIVLKNVVGIIIVIGPRPFLLKRLLLKLADIKRNLR